MIDDQLPEPQPAGALVPPPSGPITALATSAPLPPRRPSSPIRPREDFLRGIVQSALDTLDDVGDRIAGAIGLR